MKYAGIGLGKGAIVLNDLKYFIRISVGKKHVWIREYYGIWMLKYLRLMLRHL